MNDTPTIVRRADDAYQGLRALNHLTAHGAIPAPVLYDVLGTLKRLGPALGQLLVQLGDALEQSLGEYEVYQDDGADPVASVASCRDALTGAAGHAAHLGRHLESAQQALTRQGYRTQRQTPPGADPAGRRPTDPW